MIGDPLYECGVKVQRPAHDDPDKSNGRSCPRCGDPINPANGNSWQIENDYIAAGAGVLAISRFYNSNPDSGLSPVPPAFGHHWTHRYDVRLAQPKQNHVPNMQIEDCWRSAKSGHVVCLSGEKKPIDLTPNTISVSRPDGKRLMFGIANGTNGNTWLGDSDINNRLSAVYDNSSNIIGWIHVSQPDDETERYDVSGALLSVTSRSGMVQRLTYATGATNDTNVARIPADAPVCQHIQPGVAVSPGKLLCVTDNWGRQIQFEYGANGNVSKVIDPAGQQYLYIYDGPSAGCSEANANNLACHAHNLTKVVYPDGRSRTYYYNESAKINGGVGCPDAPTTSPGFGHLIHQMTGIVDENGVRYANWTYNCQGQATSSVLAGETAKVELTYSAYGDSTTSTVKNYFGDPTNPQSTTRIYNFQKVLAVLKNTGIDAPCAECGDTSARTYDANGNVISRTDWNGNQSTYAYDTARNLEISRTEGVGSPAAITISTQWHPTYRLPTAIAEPKRITNYLYDSSGNLALKTVRATNDETGDQAFSAVQVGAARNWAYTYNDVGQVLTVTGPRADNADVLTYTYDASGNLATITNAANHVTTLSEYDANGRVGRITDPNGLVTQLTYSPRGWLTSRNVGGETTSYTYDGVGQLTQVVSPDGSAISYTYDAARRLTAIADSAGNSITYTLDAQGNRTKEQVKDPDGTLTRQTTRIFDAVNRLQQVTGAPQ